MKTTPVFLMLFGGIGSSKKSSASSLHFIYNLNLNPSLLSLGFLCKVRGLRDGIAKDGKLGPLYSGLLGF